MIEAEEDARVDSFNDLQGGEECHVEARGTLLYLSSSGHTERSSDLFASK